MAGGIDYAEKLIGGGEMKRAWDVQVVYSYHEAWTAPIRAWIKLPLIPGFFLGLQEGILLLLLEGITLFLDHGLGLDFGILVQYILAPLGLVWVLSRLNPEGKLLFQWIYSYLRFLLTEKETNGALEPIDVEPATLRILSRYAPGEKPKQRRHWFRRSKTETAATS